MITEVITERGSILGYLIDYLYIEKDLVKYFTSDKNIKGIRSFGAVCDSDIKVNGKRYKSILKFFNCHYYKKVLELLISNGIQLNDVLFVQACINDVSGVSSDIWNTAKRINGTDLKYIMCADLSGTILGYMVSDCSLYFDSVYYINMIEIIEKENGYGRRIVNQLLHNGKVIKGLSLLSSSGFWEKFGVKFCNNDYHFILGSSN